MKKLLIFLVLICFSIAHYAHSVNLPEKKLIDKTFVKKDLSEQKVDFALKTTTQFVVRREYRYFINKPFPTITPEEINLLLVKDLWRPIYSLYRQKNQTNEFYQAKIARGWQA